MVEFIATVYQSHGVSTATDANAAAREGVHRSSLSDLSTAMVSDADFHDSVAGRHRRIDADDWEDIYLVGDVHGCPDELGRLVDAVDPGSDDLVVFVGDLVRNGPDNKAVVEFVRRHDNMVSVRGNNEDKLIHGRKTLATLDDPYHSFEKTVITG